MYYMDKIIFGFIHYYYFFHYYDIIYFTVNVKITKHNKHKSIFACKIRKDITFIHILV